MGLQVLQGEWGEMKNPSQWAPQEIRNSTLCHPCTEPCQQRQLWHHWDPPAQGNLSSGTLLPHWASHRTEAPRGMMLPHKPKCSNCIGSEIGTQRHSCDLGGTPHTSARGDWSPDIRRKEWFSPPFSIFFNISLLLNQCEFKSSVTAY